MIKRIVDVSNKSHIHTKHSQLCITRDDNTNTVPIEDIGVLILQHPGITISQYTIIECQKNNTIIVFCDERHLPYSIILPIADGHSTHSQILDNQISITKPTQKRLWQSVIKAKIAQQSTTLKIVGCNHIPVDVMVGKVKLADSLNHEAQAAVKYWKLLFGNDFRRDTNADGVNSLLNYGYSIIRAMVARSIVGAGLHPTIGLFHKNKYNSLCLADDLMEPFRPWIDEIVFTLWSTGQELALSKEIKTKFLGLMSEPVVYKDMKYPFMVALSYFMADYRRALTASSYKLSFPILVSRL